MAWNISINDPSLESAGSGSPRLWCNGSRDSNDLCCSGHLSGGDWKGYRMTS